MDGEFTVGLMWDFRIGLVLLLMVVLGSGPAAGDPGSVADESLKPAEVRLRVTSPVPGEVTRNRVTMAEVRGVAQSGRSDDTDFDVFILIDISHSTRYPSGLDIDEDGETGFNPHQELIAPGTYPEDVVCSDSDDTILAAEVRAARLLLEVLDPGAYAGGCDRIFGCGGSGNRRKGQLRSSETHW